MYLSQINYRVLTYAAFRNYKFFMAFIYKKYKDTTRTSQNKNKWNKNK